MAKKTSRFCEACPRKLAKTPSEACPLALEHILDAQNNKKSGANTSTGCPWAINSSEHNYCFWNLAKKLDAPMTDREISELLVIPQSSLEKITSGAINKLKQLKNSSDMQEFKEILSELIHNRNSDNTVYLPDNYNDKLNKEEASEDTIQEPPQPKIPLGIGMPVHRSGKRTDLFGLSSKKPQKEVKSAKKVSKKSN